MATLISKGRSKVRSKVRNMVRKNNDALKTIEEVTDAGKKKTEVGKDKKSREDKGMTENEDVEQDKGEKNTSGFFVAKNDLERNLSRLIAGDTGMFVILKEMKTDVEKKNINSFSFLSAIYCQRAEKLRMYREDVENILSEKDKRIFMFLLQTADLLEEYGVCGGEMFTEEMMTEWYEKTVQEEKQMCEMM